MTGLDDLLSRTRLSEIVPALGGPEPRRGRCAAWYRGGDNPQAVSLDDAGGRWYDHGSGKGGGVLSLIEVALGCTRREAAAWLANYQGVSLGQIDPATVRRLDDRRRLARERAAELIDWRDRTLLALRDVRNAAWTGAREIERETLACHPNDPATWDRIRQGIGRRECGDAIDNYLIDLMTMGARDLVDLRRRLESAPERRAA